MKIEELARLMGKRKEEIESILKSSDEIKIDLNKLE